MQMQYWYNVITGKVETDDNRSAGSDVMGPYATEADAAAAIQTAHERIEAEDASDKAWDDLNAAPGWSDDD